MRLVTPSDYARLVRAVGIEICIFFFIIVKFRNGHDDIIATAVSVAINQKYEQYNCNSNAPI